MLYLVGRVALCWRSGGAEWTRASSSRAGDSCGLRRWPGRGHSVEGLIERQEQRLAALEQELQELKQDSHDSGKPPSRDSFARKQLKRRSSRRERTDKRQPGGQPEHPGTTLRQAEQPDRVTIHAVERCGCGRSLVDEPVAEWERRQVFDVPPMQVEVSEHRAERKRCPCCGINRAEFPEAVAQPVQYGPRLQGIAAYLKNYGLLPYQRTARGSVLDRHGGASELCGSSWRQSTTPFALRDESVIGVDETGMSVEGKLWWLHVDLLHAAPQAGPGGDGRNRQPDFGPDQKLLWL